MNFFRYADNHYINLDKVEYIDASDKHIEKNGYASVWVGEDPYRIRGNDIARLKKLLNDFIND